MLYDTRWDQKTNADPFTLESLIAWLEKQPARGEYDFSETKSCALGLWLRSIDHCSTHAFGRGSFWYDVNGAPRDFHQFNDIAGTRPFTFGAALERARAAQKTDAR